MFENRKSAGIQLAEALKDYQAENPVILAIPRGGVEVAYYVAKALECNFSVVISRKLGYPDQPEAAFGAVAEDGSLYLNPQFEGILSREIIERVIQKTKKEIARRVDIYRQGRPLPSLEDRTVILVDDGIATGSTVFAAIELCKKQKAEKIIVAAPISGGHMLQKLARTVDDVIILETPRSFFAVSQGYEEFHNMTDQEVQSYLGEYSGNMESHLRR